MASMDIFNNDAFNMIELTGTVERVPYQPNLLGTLNIFEPMPVRTDHVAIEEKDRTLAIIQTSVRGAPLETHRTNKRRLRRFDTVRLAKGDRINASEIQGIRAYGSMTELRQVQDLVVEKQTDLRADMETTHELHRLGAIQGKVLDADGSTLFDWFSEYGISAPTAIQFKLDTATTNLRQICHNVSRTMQRAAKGAFVPGTRINALCGDSFFDKLIDHKWVRDTYLNRIGSEVLRENEAWREADLFGIRFINYRGTDTFADDGTGVNSIGIKSGEAKFFPTGARGLFKVAYSPAESFNFVNTPGQEIYSMMIPDRDRNMYVDIEQYSYPLYVCTRPEVLQTAVENT